MPRTSLPTWPRASSRAGRTRSSLIVPASCSSCSRASSPVVEGAEPAGAGSSCGPGGNSARVWRRRATTPIAIRPPRSRMPHQTRRACVPPHRIEEQVDEADASPDDPLPLVQRRGQSPAEPDRGRRRPCEHRSERRDRAVEKCRRADLAEDRRPDQVQPVRCGLVAGGCERGRDVVAEQAPDHENEEPHEREPDARVAQRRPPGAAREVDREPVEHEHGDEQPDAEDVARPGRRSARQRAGPTSSA